tara:strand:- start:14290 stop:15426 length:1137 start_codon:yes stop_codon:yes gene_type:complete
MSNKIIKQELDKLVAEAAISGEKVTKRAQNVSKDQNKAYYKDVEGKMKDYDKNLKQEDENSIDPKETNIEGSEKEYHDEMEIRNGQEMIQYDRDPSKQFKDRAKKALEGDSTMGNETHEGKWNPETGEGNGNTEEVWGASGGKHLGKEIVKSAEASAKKRAEQTPQFNSFGDDIENKPKGSNVKPKKIATEGMKRIKFKKPFNGVGNALKLIPEAFRVDNKQFEMTDGDESYKIKWQGSLTEGKAVVLEADSTDLMNEGFAKIKHLMGYKSENTLGTLSAKDRVNESNAIMAGFAEGNGFTNEVEEITEEEIEGQTAATVTKDSTPHANAEGDMVMNEDKKCSCGPGEECEDCAKSGSPEIVDRDASDWEKKALGNNQ